MERGRQNDGDYSFHHHHQEVDRVSNRGMTSNLLISSSQDRPSTPPLPPSRLPDGVGVGGVSYIEHRVTKIDTLAGVAIKYGVEVADIKRINGLVTDLQMFARKSIHIPQPGRHPPSTTLSNGLDNQGTSCPEQTPPCRRHSDLFESFSSLKLKSTPPQRISPAMNNLQGYYSLKPIDHKTPSEGFEMAVYRDYLKDGPFSQPLSNPPLSHHTNSKSLANGFIPENGKLAVDMLVELREGDSDKWSEKLLRRRQKSEADFSSPSPEKLQEVNSSGGGFSAIIGKGLALRSKAAASQTSSGVEADAGLLNPITVSLGDSLFSEGFNGVIKSSNTSSLKDQDNSSSSSKWSLKLAYHQALSTAAITTPRNKAALD
ncbi:uncharacterized protein LOC130791618 isoform X2 [Actinidia eriantha]|uniref:uncharacterized protein LOC130791618 isoform X2 n=1 Tax=Actinidia eriantha TaxID=165200 RepID=UPI00258CCD8A|nr:uncharacterized protein LOC130791618 isoform X2 [Actinidia eriantha]